MSFSVLRRVSSRFQGCLGKLETQGAQTLGLEAKRLGGYLGVA